MDFLNRGPSAQEKAAVELFQAVRQIALSTFAVPVAMGSFLMVTSILMTIVASFYDYYLYLDLKVKRKPIPRLLRFRLNLYGVMVLVALGLGLWLHSFSKNLQPFAESVRVKLTPILSKF